MPTPVGHALGGLIVALLLAPQRTHQGHQGDEGRDRRHQSTTTAPAKRAPTNRGSTPSDVSAANSFQNLRALRDRLDLRGLAAVCVVAACVPDIDFGWGRHNMETHSVGFALLAGMAAFAWKRSARIAIACALAVGTHVLFDWLGSDDSPPLGVMALWPFSHEFYFANAFVFEAISRRYWLPGFVWHNTLAVLRELAILLPIVIGLVSLRKRFVSLEGD